MASVVIVCYSFFGTRVIQPNCSKRDMRFFILETLLVLGLLFSVSAEATSCKTFDNVDGCLVEVGNCLYLWTNGIRATVDRGLFNYLQTFASTPDELKYEGTCNDPISLKLKFKNSYESLEADIEIKSQTKKNSWKVQKFNIELKGKLDASYELDPREIYLVDGFSFSCASLVLRPRPNSTEDNLKLYINRFQLQPFGTNSSNIFVESFDCATWFSLPTWMGLITLMLFTFVVSFGVYYLMDIRTMDRFENPKSKPISVPTSD